ncbi:glycosyltransferase [Xanthobacter sp. YC-JY1]|uniref:glycosyltransferase n=1 Tax=Xanthobacter sp. YC-JY1 TaxID=2419844 RepID=UPI001F333340|nr:glycosyltransferase [Xanthobacter sp. YC-JY1]
MRQHQGGAVDVVFLDGGLNARGGHSYSLVKKVGAAVAARGHRVRIFGMRTMDREIADELGAVPHFSASLYDSVQPTPWELARHRFGGALRLQRARSHLLRERISAERLNAGFRADLEALPAGVLARGTLVVLPNVMQNQIMGVVQALSALPEAGRPRVVCQLMFAPDWIPWRRSGQLGPGIYAQAFALARPLMGRCLVFGTENAAIAALYRDGYGIEPIRLPVPFGNVERARPVPERPVFGFLGVSKNDKGFHLLPDAIRLCREQGLAGDFVVQVQRDGHEAETAAAEQALRALPYVRLIDRVLTDEDFAAETRKVDAMLLPYDPQVFGMRGSGIFTQSAAAGRPVVASAGTYAAASIASGDAEGEVFAPYDAAAFAAAILRLAGRLEDSHARAAGLADRFAHATSAEAYADALLAQAGAPSA